MMHFGTSIKVDLIVRKTTEYRLLEFKRRKPAVLGDVATWIVSREDLILSKLAWMSDTRSEMQRRDITQLLAGPLDHQYLKSWADVLGVRSALDDMLR